jgi:hypothetical protein
LSLQDERLLERIFGQSDGTTFIFARQFNQADKIKAR